MDTINVAIQKPIEVSKELEKINFSTLFIDKARKKEVTYDKKHTTELKKKKKKVRYDKEDTQFQVFQKSMRMMLIFGQCLGLNPFLGVTKNDVTKVRFTVFSGRFLYAIFILVSQIIGTCFCIYRFMNNVFSVGALGYFSFYISTASTTFLFLKVGRKWPRLVEEIHNSELNEYIDNKTKWKCNSATIILLTFAFTEHIFATTNRLVAIINCKTNETLIYEEYIRVTFPWLDDANVPIYLPLGILLQFQIIVTTMNWNYSDLFVVCISMYLTGILEKINDKILLASKKTNLTPAYWCSLREAYTRATGLVRHFDEVINGIIFTSFATNLFFICLQLFNVLANGITTRQGREKCPNYVRGPLRGYENAVYLTFSLCFLFGRSLAVSLYAAGVHTASQVPAPALYEVPSCVYCEEIQRFIDQVHGNKVALSGLNFFYVTKELALSVAATVVTYELVLLQFSGE
uniref:Gustatory receptor n=1 Tax=Dendrolimus punctatus TaxID=238572 RepID=A0A2K8GL52_9NEOP|nr:antennal gustatory receptor sugar taste 64f [Dendrolimus punctatus]